MMGEIDIIFSDEEEGEEEYSPLNPTRYDLILRKRVEINHLKKSKEYIETTEDMIQRQNQASYASDILSKADKLLLGNNDINQGSSRHIGLESKSQIIVGDSIVDVGKHNIIDVGSNNAHKTAQSVMTSLGWSPGEGLGMDRDGLKNPLVVDVQKAGHGIVREGPSLVDPLSRQSSKSNSNDNEAMTFFSSTCSNLYLGGIIKKNLDMIKISPSKVLVSIFLPDFIVSLNGALKKEEGVEVFQNDGSINQEVLKEAFIDLFSEFGSVEDVLFKSKENKHYRIFIIYESAEESLVAMKAKPKIHDITVPLNFYDYRMYNEKRFFIQGS